MVKSQKGISVSASSLATSRRLRGAAIASVVVAVAALVIPQVDAAGSEAGGVASEPLAPGAAASGVPTYVHLPADQAAHTSATNEWWYTVGQVSSHGHQYGYEVQLTKGGTTQIAITDVTAGTYYQQVSTFKSGQFSLSATDLDVRMPNATLSGAMDAMHLTASLPEGSLDLQLSAKGPAMYGNGTGQFPFLGGSSYYYSLPDLRTTGTLTLNGTTSAVDGTSWLDRQWGTWDWSQLNKWTWMSVQLGNGESINLWDLFDKQQGEQHWATVLHSDGSESVVSVEPLAPDATHFATSPTTGQRYAGKWTVRVPSLHTTLTVTASPTLQEISSQSGGSVSPGINESASSVVGTYQGRPVTGKAYVEQFGLWK
jgi:predicted secreted hydrolase